MATLGAAPGIMIGTGVGAAASAALEPIVEPGRQQAWFNSPHRVLDPALLARLVAQGAVELKSAQETSKRSGFDTDKLDQLIWLAQTVPGFAEALAIWRRWDSHRGSASQDVPALLPDFGTLWTHTHRKEQLDHRYEQYLDDLKNERLTPAQIALGIVRSLIQDPGLMPVSLEIDQADVPRYRQSTIHPIWEAQDAGIDEERLRVMVGEIGLPMSVIQAAQAEFRGIVNRQSVNLAGLEGDTRPEWIEPLYELAREIITANNAAELELRGFLNRNQRLAHTARHGMSETDSDLLYNLLGRAPGVHAITTGLARGATFPSDYSNIPEPYKSAIQRSNIRPEYAEIEYHDRYSYPSGFQIKAETQTGDLSQADSEQILLEIGWSPKWAKFFSDAWAKPKASSSQSHVSKAQTQLWTQLHKSYLDNTVPVADAHTHLTTIGVPAGQQDQVLNVWNAERDLVRKNLTAKQIIKAASTDPVYGTEAQKLQALQDIGYTLFEAQTLLAEG